ncbi:hypothetical protein [Spiroplasma eriocheiris]|uniref:Transmembrane protein n=1 Tax=Spiroplasma eriocheiris TaxID=315358 RepID=A0A0H3XHH1_9MOLU|nr:hypothetical protein [Spiroplasma eriocheiris]AHF57696.1 hypothetical protein SPE_0568 [Spiroplasma eriocheiris CCTCC M 207170]AKM54148.1 hypothetical protein SERIO_v1c05770 [Spiroplasma eriocheiris]
MIVFLGLLFFHSALLFTKIKYNASHCQQNKISVVFIFLLISIVIIAIFNILVLDLISYLKHHLIWFLNISLLFFFIMFTIINANSKIIYEISRFFLIFFSLSIFAFIFKFYNLIHYGWLILIAALLFLTFGLTLLTFKFEHNILLKRITNYLHWLVWYFLASCSIFLIMQFNQKLQLKKMITEILTILVINQVIINILLWFIYKWKNNSQIINQLKHLIIIEKTLFRSFLLTNFLFKKPIVINGYRQVKNN